MAHSNEITAIPQLLRLLDLRGCLVTIDAMGGPKSSARQIVAGGTDYLLAVKGNQGELYANGQDAFQCAAGTEKGWLGSRLLAESTIQLKCNCPARETLKTMRSPGCSV